MFQILVSWFFYLIQCRNPFVSLVKICGTIPDIPGMLDRIGNAIEFKEMKVLYFPNKIPFTMAKFLIAHKFQVAQLFPSATAAIIGMLPGWKIENRGQFNNYKGPKRKPLWAWYHLVNHELRICFQISFNIQKGVLEQTIHQLDYSKYTCH